MHAYRLMLTKPVVVASAERCFSNSKLIKNYLRSTMSQSQERLKEILEKFEYKGLPILHIKELENQILKKKTKMLYRILKSLSL